MRRQRGTGFPAAQSARTITAAREPSCRSTTYTVTGFPWAVAVPTATTAPGSEGSQDVVTLWGTAAAALPAWAELDEVGALVGAASSAAVTARRSFAALLTSPRSPRVWVVDDCDNDW